MKTSATCQDRLWKRVYGDFERSMESEKRRSGGDGGVETPVPIPNTEVKHPSGDDSWPCACENSSLPGLFLCNLTLTHRKKRNKTLSKDKTYYLYHYHYAIWSAANLTSSGIFTPRFCSFDKWLFILLSLVFDE